MKENIKSMTELIDDSPEKSMIKIITCYCKLFLIIKQLHAIVND